MRVYWGVVTRLTPRSEMMWERGAEHRAAGDLARGAPGDPSLVSGHHHIMLTSRVKFQPFTPTANYKYNCNDNCIYRRLVIALPRSRHLGYVTVASAGMTDSSDVVTSRHRVNRSILNGPAAVNQSCHKIAPSLLSQDYSRDRPCPWSRADLTLTACFHPVSAARRFGLGGPCGALTLSLTLISHSSSDPASSSHSHRPSYRGIIVWSWPVTNVSVRPFPW